MVAVVEYNIVDNRFIFSKVIDVISFEDSVLSDEEIQEKGLIRVWVDPNTNIHIIWAEAREMKIVHRQIEVERIKKGNTKISFTALEQVKQIIREKRFKQILDK